MSISIKAILHAYAATLTKTWAHDRSKTVGASEIGQCARKVYFDKHDAPRDAGYVDGWGARLRGTLIEDHYWVVGLRAALPEGWRLLYAGEEQETLIDGYLSATTDGLLVNDTTGESINLDCKSIDPRSDLRKEKSEHAFQVQVQVGLIRLKTSFRPDYSIVSYINASFFDDITEFRLPFSRQIFHAAQARARTIMTASSALDLPPEGKMAGGDECRYCAWASHCADVTVAGVPKEEKALDGEAMTRLKMLRDEEREASRIKDEWKNQHAAKTEQIKQFMRAQNSRAYRGDGWSVSYSAVSGKATLDLAAIEAAGIDLEPFYKTGKSSERLTVK